MNVYIGGTKSYSAMQGPCPDGFHVPMESECEAMYNMGISLGAWTSSTPSNIKTYLKLPAAGDRSRTTGSVEGQGGATGLCWTASVNSSGLILTFGYDSSNVYYNIGQYRSLGRPIRAFKDIPVKPISSWTKLYGTSIESGGIFWSSTDGLISLSSNGSNWITIADKNLGATTVYSDGATLSEANCGKYFQWGNNYGFPFTGSVTTSSTKVNAQNYGPGNYYSSSTFITVNSGAPNSWDSSNNKNLRGGETGIISPAELKNAYIGKYPTIFEYDFTQSDAGWTLDSGVLRDSNGFYVNGTLVDKKITAPSEIFDGIPNKIQLEFYRPNVQVGTGFMNLSVSPTLMIECPRNNTSYIQYVGFYDGTWTNINVGTVPTGNMTWEVDIDSSTSNWDNVHKITGLSNISESNGVLKKIWESGIFQIRIVNWDNTGLRIKKIKFYY